MNLINFQTSLSASLESVASAEFCLRLFLPPRQPGKMHVINFINNLRDRKAADNFRLLEIILLEDQTRSTFPAEDNLSRNAEHALCKLIKCDATTFSVLRCPSKNVLKRENP